MKLLKLLTAALGVAIMHSSLALASEVTLTVHHFLSPKSPAHTQLIKPWADRIEKQSNGRIKIEIFPSMSMGGKPPELYNQVRDGAADIIWTLAGYTPGVFPRTEVFELPTIHKNSAVATNLAIQDMSDAIAEDFKDVHPLLIHVHAGNAFHMRKGGISSAKDLEGLKVRTPSRSGAWLLESLGAEPVGMPVPALPQALSKGAVDGALVPFEILIPLKLHQLTEQSIEGQDALRFGTSVFIFAMNKDRYEALPDDLKTIIDDNSGAKIAKSIGEAWMQVETVGKKLQAGSKNGEVTTLTAAATAEIESMTASVVERWIKEVSAKGIDGAKLAEDARTAISAHSK